MVCRYDFFISREPVYILRRFHSYSFASYESLCALKVKYPMSEGCQFFIDISAKSVHKVSAFMVLLVVCLLYFEPFRVSVSLLSVFQIHIYKEYA